MILTKVDRLRLRRTQSRRRPISSSSVMKRSATNTRRCSSICSNNNNESSSIAVAISSQEEYAAYPTVACTARMSDWKRKTKINLTVEAAIAAERRRITQSFPDHLGKKSNVFNPRLVIQHREEMHAAGSCPPPAQDFGAGPDPPERRS